MNAATAEDLASEVAKRQDVVAAFGGLIVSTFARDDDEIHLNRHDDSIISVSRFLKILITNTNSSEFFLYCR